MTKTFYYRDNTGGSNLRSSEAKINQTQQATEMWYIQNLDIYRDGGFQSQLGNTQLNTDVTDATAIVGLGQYKTDDATKIMYTKASGKAYSIDIDGGPEVEIPVYVSGATTPTLVTPLDDEALVKWVEYNGVVTFWNGVDNPWQYDGASALTLTGTPTAWSSSKPYTADVDGGRRIFAAAESSIYYCALGDQNDWTTASDAGSFTDIFNDSTSIINVSNYGDRVSFQSRKPAIYLLSGTAPSSYAVNKIASNRSAAGKLCVATVQDYQYFFSGDAILPIITTELGIIKLGKEYDISQKIKPFITGTESELPLLPIDQNSIDTAITLPYDFKNQLVTYFKSSGSSTYDVAAIYNFDTNGWIFRTATPVTAAARVGDDIITGTSDGKILKEFSGISPVSGTFLKKVISPFFDFGVPDKQKQIVRFYIVFKANTNLDLTFNLYTNYSRTRAYTQAVTSMGISENAYGTAIYGTSTYASSQIVDVAFPINIQAKSFQFELIANDSEMDFRVIYYAFEIEGLDAH